MKEDILDRQVSLCGGFILCSIVQDTKSQIGLGDGLHLPLSVSASGVMILEPTIVAICVENYRN